MNIFEKMIDDCFSVPEFIEEFYLQDGSAVTTVSYAMNYSEVYTQYGIDPGISFYLTCKVSDFTPQKGLKITFRDKVYKIDNFSADAFNLTWKIYLKGINSK